MIVENRGQQQSIRYVIDTDRCCGCKRCIRRCMENVWQWDEEKKCAYPKWMEHIISVCSGITGGGIHGRAIENRRKLEKHPEEHGAQP